MKRTTILYLLILTLVGFSMLWILQLGSTLAPPEGTVVRQVVAEGSGGPTELLRGIFNNFKNPLSHLLLQLIVIISVSRLMGRVFFLIGQPPVVGEMAAGILLGPSLFGWLVPPFFHFVFPPESLGTLQLLSQVGVCLFMFSVGMELNLRQVRHQAQTAIVVSHASIVIPCLLGVGLAYFLFTSLAGPKATFTAFALFMGISMSITAFPVLARILQERGLSGTPLGDTAITCAAVDDVTAWSLLAFVVAIASSSSMEGCLLSVALVLVFLGIMIFGIKPGLPRWLGADRLSRETPSRGTLATVVCVVVASALCTEAIGIHALFGAFLAGAIMPEIPGFRQKLGIRVENFSSVLLLPLFFVFTGLRTQIGLLSTAQDWLLCLLIIFVATLGKLGGGAFTARLTGMSWRESLKLGALMNTRGLMELIALNIGYDLGILSPRIFTMLVIMALATTMLTGPLLTLFSGRQAALRDIPEPAHS